VFPGFFYFYSLESISIFLQSLGQPRETKPMFFGFDMTQRSNEKGSSIQPPSLPRPLSSSAASGSPITMRTYPRNDDKERHLRRPRPGRIAAPFSRRAGRERREGGHKACRKSQEISPGASLVMDQQKAPAFDRGQVLDFLVPLDGIELSTFALRMRDSSQTCALTNLNKSIQSSMLVLH
jgi:hypothetical protein